MFSFRKAKFSWKGGKRSEQNADWLGGLAMGIGLMMLPGIRQDVQKGANKVKKAVQDMSEGQQ